MRKLDRTQVQCPACLDSYTPGSQNWNDVTAQDKAHIRQSLHGFQGTCCAYCEGPLKDFGLHIEHFLRKHHFPQHTFDWSNLFLACDQNDSCGHFKDTKAGKYYPNDLLNPCNDDPDDFLRFRTDGTVAARRELEPSERHRANETLRVFNLNGPARLRNMRKKAASTYLQLQGQLEVMPAAECIEYLQTEMQRLGDEPFSAASRQLLQAALQNAGAQ